jgi:dephospho-CoA kinase
MSQPSTESLPLRIVVSGGIGSGKSTVTARLRELGAVVIEADLLGHEVLEPDGTAFAAVAARWPAAVVDGTISRPALAAIVFSDLDQLSELESLTHPAIAAEIAHLVQAAGSSPVVLELPVALDLVGPGWIRVVVEAEEEARMSRAVGRGGDEDDIRQRMEAQASPQEWRRAADYVIGNDGTKAELISAVDELWAKLLTALDIHGDAGHRTPDAGPTGTGS